MDSLDTPYCLHQRHWNAILDAPTAFHRLLNNLSLMLIGQMYVHLCCMSLYSAGTVAPPAHHHRQQLTHNRHSSHWQLPDQSHPSLDVPLPHLHHRNCGAYMRITTGNNLPHLVNMELRALDATRIHPENYRLAVSEFFCGTLCLKCSFQAALTQWWYLCFKLAWIEMALFDLINLALCICTCTPELAWHTLSGVQ